MSEAIPFSGSGYSTFNFPKVAVGNESTILSNIWDEITVYFNETETLGYKDKLLQSLNEVLEECSEQGWDGYDAFPITEDVYYEAQRLIKCLPLISFDMLPEIIPEPGGGIALEWYRDKHSVFIASVSGKNEIAYAGLFGINKSHGTEYFGDSLPSVILDHISRLKS